MHQTYWSPIAGCTKVDKSCDRCCPFVTDFPCFRNPQTFGLERIAKDGEWTGVVNVVEKEFARPFALPTEGAVVWTAQMSDLFHPDVSEAVRSRVLGVIARLPQHLFVVTTKRPGAMEQCLGSETIAARVAKAAKEWDGVRGARPYDGQWPLPNLCVGVSCSNQTTADKAIPALMRVELAYRLAWLAPIRGAVRLSSWPNLDWVVCRGEVGAGKKPTKKWVEDVRDFCVKNEIPFHFRGWGDGTALLDDRKWTESPRLS